MKEILVFLFNLIILTGKEKPVSLKLNTQFFERDTGFSFPVNIIKLKKNDSRWKYTFWHNFFFNPYLNANIEIFHFSPIKNKFKQI